MKKTIAIILTILALIPVTAVYARNIEFHDGVYRGGKYEFDFGRPKKNYMIVIPQEIPEPKAYGNGYVGRVEMPEREYEIIMLDNSEVRV